MNFYRTGDISYHPAELPKGAEKIASKSFVIAEGETTGHLHEVKVKEGTVDILRDSQGKLFIVIYGKAILTHPEHKTIEVPSGTYKIVNEREYNWFEQAVQKVQD